MSVAAQISNLLDRGFGRTKTGQKLLQELEQARLDIETEEGAARKSMAADLAVALTAEAGDEELNRMITERDAFCSSARRLRRSSVLAEGADINQIEVMNRRIGQRQRGYRNRIQSLRRSLKESAPAWMQDAVASFVANLEDIRSEVAALPRLLEEKTGYGVNDGRERVVKVLDFVEYRDAMIGPGSRFGQGWLGQAGAQARKLLLEVLTPGECKQRLAAIRKSQPVQKATWRNV